MLKDLCFEVIQACPNKCKFCSSNSSKEAQTIITLEQFKKTITHFINNGGIGEVSISGGEPFLHAQLFEMIEFCKNNDLKTVVFTSGIKRLGKIPDKMVEQLKNKCKQTMQEIEKNEPWNEQLKQKVQKYYEHYINLEEYTSISKAEFEYLKKIGLDKIVFDWQALNEEIDNNLMGRKRINTHVMTSLIRAKNAGLNVDVHFVPMKPNYKEFSDIIECLEIANVQNISVLNFVPQGRGRKFKDELMLSKEELKEFAEILNIEKEKFSGKIRIGIPLNSKISHLCTAGTEKLDIKYDGTVLPCPAFKEISSETMEKYGIKLYNIYEDLEKIVVSGGKRTQPLCKQIYGFKGNLIEKLAEER